MKRLKRFMLMIATLFLSTLIPTLAQQTQFVDPAMLYIKSFQAAMDDMYPTEKFAFDLVPGQQTNFSLWAPADAGKVTVAFYINNDQNPSRVTGKGFFVSCSVRNGGTQAFAHQKLAACAIEITSRPSLVKLNFRAEEEPVTVYLQYEFNKIQAQTNRSMSMNQSAPTKQQDKSKKLSAITQKFEKVKKKTQLQQGALRLLTKSFNKHNIRLGKNIKYAYHRLMIQTILVVASGVVGLWVIRRQMNKGYEMLV